jgi:hypothetical protein
VYLFNLADELKPMPKSEKNTSSNNEPVFKLVDEQVVDESCTSSDTGTEQALVSYINNTNITNNPNILKVTNLDEQAQNFQDDGSIFKNQDAEKKEKKLREKKKSLLDSPTPIEKNYEIVDKKHFVTSSVSSRAQLRDEKPTIEDVKTYFLEQSFPEIEARKFFNYFSSNGWLVGGKTPMVDWKAAAQNWMINANKFNTNEQYQPNRAKHLNTTIDKDYAEPL